MEQHYPSRYPQRIDDKNQQACLGFQVGTMVVANKAGQVEGPTRMVSDVISGLQIEEMMVSSLLHQADRLSRV